MIIKRDRHQLKISKLFKGAVQLIFAASFCLLSLNALSAELPGEDIVEPVPSCTQVCYQTKSGKARRSCSKVCRAAEASCADVNGSYEFQAGSYVCSTSNNIGIAKH